MFDDNDLAEFEVLNKPDAYTECEVANFFRDNLVKTRSAVSAADFHKFIGLKSNGARVAFVLGYRAAHELPVEVDNYERKDSDMVAHFKRNGNSAFGMAHYPVAVEDYNHAIPVASKEELPIILANRAAAFYHLEKFKLALRDCDEAVKLGYPKNLMYKLEERRARCLLGLKCHFKAMEAFRRAIRALDDSGLTSEKKLKLEADMRVMLSVMDKGSQMSRKKQGEVDQAALLEIENNNLKEKDTLPRIKDRNPTFPSLNKAVDIRDTETDVGRYAVATRTIQPGEILAVEKPYCVGILEEYRRTHCHRCTMRFEAPFPASCYKCSSIAYCSPRCRDADEKLHQIECELLGPLWCSKASITCLLALRAVIQEPYERRFVGFRKGDALKIKLGKEAYVSQDYKTFYNLVTHDDERTPEDLFHRAYMAAWLLRVLKTSSYIPESCKSPDKAESQLSDGEIIIADAILHHLQLLQFNSHEISEFVRKPKDMDLSKGKSIFVGGGVYPTVALFNHSCNPDVLRYFVGNTIIVRAVKTILAGNEISENYGPMFTENDENERKRQLRLQYWFECNCEACKDHWPTLDKIDPTLLRFKCDTGPSCGNILLVDMNTEIFMIPCSKCGKSTNILKGLKAMQDTDALYKTAHRFSEAGNYENACKSYLSILKILDENLALPLKDYHVCQQAVRNCMLALGNSWMVTPKIRDQKK